MLISIAVIKANVQVRIMEIHIVNATKDGKEIIATKQQQHLKLQHHPMLTRVISRFAVMAIVTSIKSAKQSASVMKDGKEMIVEMKSVGASY